MPWFILILAGLFEVVWASLLDETDGFTRWLPTAGFVLALAASMYLLSVAVQSIPVGVAYAVWVGVGAVGAYLVAVLIKGEPTNPAQALAVSALVMSIVAVKATATS